jgi:hypothetical protein
MGDDDLALPLIPTLPHQLPERLGNWEVIGGSYWFIAIKRHR